MEVHGTIQIPDGPHGRGGCIRLLEIEQDDGQGSIWMVERNDFPNPWSEQYESKREAIEVIAEAWQEDDEQLVQCTRCHLREYYRDIHEIYQGVANNGVSIVQPYCEHCAEVVENESEDEEELRLRARAEEYMRSLREAGNTRLYPAGPSGWGYDEDSGAYWVLADEFSSGGRTGRQMEVIVRDGEHPFYRVLPERYACQI